MSSSVPGLVEVLDNKLLDLSKFMVDNQATLPTSTCQERYATLCPAHKSALKNLVPIKQRKAKKAATRKDRQQKFFSIKSVEPSTELQGRIRIWTNDFGSFFKDSGHPIAQSYYGFSTSFTRVSKNQEIREVATIQRRFDIESIYLRVVSSGHHTGKRWHKGGSACLARQLKQSPLVLDEVGEVQKKLEKYVELGSSLHLWAGRLGGPGYFIVLPQTVPEGL
ncbi:MAG: hypothetical protein LQ343_005348 [Gyalolechia ehrenbergii]|nr:MAG: hypothetical protein LQ343_005348 [Gyalolechia ehrenbergii]